MLRFSSLAKITPPSFTGVYPRERLYKLLDQALNKQAVWISGPPGSGKTSLVSSYLNTRGVKNLWYQVDEGDADIATFFYYMRLAVPRVTPRRGTPLPLLTPEFLGGILAFARRYCQNLYKRLDPPFILILDNYHEVPEESSFHEVIRAAVNELPKDAHAIFISRLEPPPILARFRANEIMETIGWNDLQLSEEESRGIIKLKSKVTCPTEQIHMLHQKTQGWVAGLIIMLEQARLKDIPLQALSEYTPEDIIDYFSGEIFHELDTTTQDILLKTTFLPRMTIQMADELCGSDLAGQLISNMSQNNIFTTHYIQPKPEYQYHPLFREFLLAQAQRLWSPEALHGVQQEAATLLEKHGMVEDAIILLRESENWPELVTLILKWAAYLVENGRTQTLEESLSRIPTSTLDQSPWLLYWLGVCRQPFEPKVSQDYLERAFSYFRSLQDPVGTYSAWCEIGIAIQSDESGNYNHLDNWISTLDELMNEFSEFPSPEIHDRVATVMFIALTMHMPQHPLMDAWEKRALTVFHTCKKPRVQAEIGAYLSLHHLMSGDTFKAEIEASTLRGLAESKEAPAIAMVLGRTAEALYYWRVGQFEDCLQTVSAGLEISDQTGVHLWDFLQLGTGLSCVLSMGKLDTAQEYIEKMTPDMDGPRRMVVCYYRYLASWDAYLRGDFNNALEHAENALQAAIETGIPYFEGLTNLASAIVKHALDKKEESIDYLDKAMRLSIHINSQILEYMCLLTESQFALDEGNDEGLGKSLIKAFEIGRKNKYTNFSWWLPGSMTQLCSKALEYGIETDYVKNLIKKRNLIPEPSMFDVDNWPWEIKVFALGRFEILKQDTRLSFSRKAQKKPLELLKLILTSGGKDVPEEKICGTLWADAEGDSAHRSFTSAMHRLRKLLGNDQCIKLVDGKVSLDPRYFWVDYWGLERLLDEVENIDKSNNRDESEYMQIFQKTMSLYQGVFLPGDTEVPWTMAMRDRLRSRFINYISKMGQELERSENWDMATELYKKGLETDNLAEEFYRNLMNCYLHLNMKAEGLAVYQRCKTLLSVVLGSTPSDATESVHMSLSKLA